MTEERQTLLEVKHLRTSFFTHVGEVQAVRDVSFTLRAGETLGIVGESGSGKSVTCMSVMRLLSGAGRIVGGEVLFKGQNLAALPEREMARLRGDRISMVFQDPMTALNPVFTIGALMGEVIRRHKKVSRQEARETAVRMLSLVGIPSPAERLRSYPHEFSGGQRQRVLIAMALSCGPELLIADEPTTALDVTIQAQVLDLIREIREKLGTAVILITHDLGVIAETCRRVLVLYGGMVMEEARVDDLFHDPQNPYTVGLLRSVPDPTRPGRERLIPIPGSPPDLLNPPLGCPFCPRCPHAMRVCFAELPPLYRVGKGHRSRCWLLEPEAPQAEGYRKGEKADG